MSDKTEGKMKYSDKTNSIFTAKFDKCGKKTNTMFFLEKYPTHKKKFEECLELNS